MANKSELALLDTINPNKFDITMSALLIGLDAEKYTDIFRKNNIGQCTLMELSDEDLIKLGIDDETIRTKLLEEIKNFPIYNEMVHDDISSLNLNIAEIIKTLEESSEHLYRIYLSMMANALALKRAKVVDCLLDSDKYSSQISLSSLSYMTKILNSMEISLHTQMKVQSKELKHRKTKKVIIASMGSVLIAILSVCFINSLKHL